MIPTWEDKYEYLIDLGKNLSAFPEDQKKDEHLVRGCQSKVWLIAEEKQGKLYFFADADALITKGLVALLLEVFQGHKPSQILETPLDFLTEMELEKHLSPTRSNGLRQMVLKIKSFAKYYQDRVPILPVFDLDESDQKEQKTKIIEILQTIFDPEIPVDIYALGLIYEIKVFSDGKVDIEMTLTSPNCPVAESLPAEVKTKVKSLQKVSEVEVKIVFYPPWNKDMMSEEAKLELGFL